MSIKPISTTYKGYEMRSRLEARWAVFFDALGIKWEYEPEGFDIDGIWYLPDFKILTPQNRICWYEIKPSHITQSDKFDAFQKGLDELAVIEDEWHSDKVQFSEIISGDPQSILPDYAFKCEFNICPRCGLITSRTENKTSPPEYHYSNSDGSDFNNVYGFSCHHCDFTTPCGGDQEIEEGLLTKVRPHKGWVMFDPWEDYFAKIKKACEHSRSYRFY